MTEKSGKTLDGRSLGIQSDIDNMHDWFYSNKLTVSNVKSSCILIGSSQRLIASILDLLLQETYE